MKEKSDLLKAVIAQIEDWISQSQSDYTSIVSKEGRVFLGYDADLDRIDLSIFTINEEYKKRGIARSIIQNAILVNRRSVRISGIIPEGWFQSLKNYKFDGFTTNVVPRHPERHFNIEFQKIVLADQSEV